MPFHFRSTIIASIIIMILCGDLPSQKTVNLVPIGNLADGNPGDIQIQDLKKTIRQLKKKNTWLLGLGDYTDKDGFSGNPGTMNAIRLKVLKDLSKETKESIFIAGDRDWDNSGPKGLDKSLDLQKYIRKELDIKRSFFPTDGCPGPKVIKINSAAVAVILNSQWFLHGHDKPIFPSTDCDNTSTLEFWEDLEGILDEYSDRRIIISAHHPVYSSGQAAGNKLAKNHLIPIIGSFYNSFRKNIGYSSDFANPKYKEYRHKMRELLANYDNILYISGHEENIEIIKKGENTYLNAGALLSNTGAEKSTDHLYTTDQNGYVIITLSDDKALDIKIHTTGNKASMITIPWYRESKDFNIDAIPAVFPEGPSEAIAGQEYDAKGFHKFWMGDHYRKEWTTSVKVPNLDLTQIYGGLEPYARGGGLQTNSLKFKAPDGTKYSFRSVNKNPERALTALVQQTVYKHLVKDLITTQHPYGGLVAAELLNHTDILHVNPQLFFLPPQRALGFYNSDFGGSLGTLELRPSTSGDEPFGGADDIVSSHQMFHSLYKHDDHKPDKIAYAKARAFDMWMGDWDRHEDNWKWAVYKESDKTIYRPIPRDRDHVFSQWEGIIPSLADLAIPNAEHFDYDYKNLKHLNWKARHLDRQLGNELSLDDWLEAGAYLRNSIDTSDIRNAIKALPDEIEDISGEEIYLKLKNRLATIDKAMRGNYKLLAKDVDIPGSNKKEEFIVTGNNDGSIEVVIKEKSTPVYRRTFIPGQTKIINLYGLEGKDDFIIDMKHRSPIKVRIISGEGPDNILDLHPSVKKKVNIYDKYEKDHIPNRSGMNLVKHFKDPVYDNKRFEYPAFFPFPGIKNSSGNGLGLQLNIGLSKVGFNKPEYSQKFNFEGIYYPGIDAHHLSVNHRYRNMWKDLDGTTSILFSSLYSKYPFFYGLGNESVRDDELAEEEYYRIDYNTLKATYQLTKTFWRKSTFSPELSYEYNNVVSIDEEETFFPATPQISDSGKQHLYGIGATLDINFKDNDLFTTNGSHFLASWQSYLGNVSNFSRITGLLAQYQSFNLLSPTTFILRVGGSTVIGAAPFYQQSTLGSNSYLRGHVRNRFVDRSSIYYNTEIRMHLGTWRTILAPLKFGVFALHDSGKVFDGSLNLHGTFHSTYGGGAYLAPIDESYSLIFTIANSDDKETYVKIEFGWGL